VNKKSDECNECTPASIDRSHQRRPAKDGVLTLPYRDEKFLDSTDGRPIRILAEYLAPLSAFSRERVQDTVVFFGSARASPSGPLERYYEDARQLAQLVTRWSTQISPDQSRLVVCTGGGGGIMEAANRGAKEAGGRTIGLNIGLPHEQRPNAFVDPELSFEFHYFFMRKLWFAHLARAVVIFPGGFGTLDEMFELLTLRQTRKLDRDICVLTYGSDYWRDVVNFEALARTGAISPSDLKLFHSVDSPENALQCLQQNVSLSANTGCPAIARSISTCARPQCESA
jgi:uncharacterized protein (TIGR00730 family)